MLSTLRHALALAALCLCLTRLPLRAEPIHLREKACFWLGSSPDSAAFAVLKRLARTEPAPQLREKLTFDLTLAKQSGATDELIRMVHTDPSANVRKQAQFWMAHLGSDRMLADLRSARHHGSRGTFT